MTDESREFRDNVKYAKTHEWARLEEDGTVTVGISDYAQDSLGDVVYVELPEMEDELAAGDEAGVVESVKAASDIYSPVTGKVIALNDDLEDAPEIVNESPFDKGWFYKLKPTDANELEALLDSAAYQSLCDEEAH